MPSQAVIIFPALLGTAVSMISLTSLALTKYKPSRPQNLSQLAASSKASLRTFRWVLLICAALFGATSWYFIAPHTVYTQAIRVVTAVLCLSDIALAAVPIRSRVETFFHRICGYTMGITMVTLAWILAVSLTGFAQIGEVGIAVAMTALGIAAYTDRRHFLFYELPYLYLSHLSIVVAALALV